MCAAIPFLRESQAGRMILVASAGALNGFAGENFADSVARGGVVSMTYVLARALAKDGITVNCIARSALIDDHEPRPGGYTTVGMEAVTPLSRIGTAEEFGALAAYIASEESAHTTGHVFDLTGGLNLA